MSYWKNEELKPVKQTQRSIPSRNGLSYSGGQRVELVIPPNIKLFDGRKTYLNFNVLLSLPAGASPTRLMLDPVLGGQSLIKNVRIYSNGAVGGGRTLLEEIVDYNVKVGIQYDYDADESMRKMRALKEGACINTPANRCNRGTSVSYAIDTKTNPYFQGQGADPTTEPFTNAKMLNQKISIPLHTGIFADSFKAFPNEIVGGCLVEIDLESPERCVKQLDSVSKNRRPRHNPVFAGIDLGAGLVAWRNNGATDKNTALWCKMDNNIVSVENFPFVVGEKVGICKKDTITSIANLELASSGAESHITITEISVDATHTNYIKVSYAETQNSATDSEVITIDDAWILYSASVDHARPTTANTLKALDSYSVGMVVSNVELVVQSLELTPDEEKKMMDGLKNNGSLELDIISATNYKHSLLKENRQATINLPLSNTRAKSVVVVPTDAEVYNSAQRIGAIGTYIEEQKTAQDVFDVMLRSNRSGMVGCIDSMTEYIMNIDDELTPSRPVSVKKANKGLSISAQHLAELDKALNQGGIVPRSFSEYNRNFCFGRAYSSGNGVADLRNRTNQIQISYNETSAPSVNKLLMCWVFHLRKIIVSQNSISVQL